MTPINVGAYTGRVSGSLGQNSYGANPNLPQYQIRGAGPEAWFGPSQPLVPFAPPGTGGRQFDYPFGLNLLYTPRGDSEVSFMVLRNLADALPEVRIAIEHRKAEVAAWEWDIQPILTAKDRRKSSGKAKDDDPRALKIKSYLRKPDKRRHFAMWLGALMEDMLVVDAATIYPRYTEGGDLWSLDTVDGTTIKPLIDETGRPPMPDEGPAYQQVLHGVPAADFAFDELMYLPRNVRTGKLYGMSPVEQIVLTVNIALRRQISVLNYYTDGNVPEGFFSLPREWSPDQIQQFQEWWDSKIAGNLAERRRMRFMPADGELIETKQPPLKDQYDEWLMRIICAAFNVSPSPFVNDNTRATAQTVQLTTSQRGVQATKLWIKAFMDDIIQERLGYDDLEFVWSGDDGLDPLEDAQTHQILVSCGIMTVDEARVERGLDPFGIGPTTSQPVTPLLESYKASVENIENPPPPPTVVHAPPGKDTQALTDDKGTQQQKQPAAAEKAALLTKADVEAIAREVAKLSRTPFADSSERLVTKRPRARKLPPIDYDRKAAVDAQSDLHMLWRQVFQRQLRNAGRKLLGTLGKAEPAAKKPSDADIDKIIAGLDLDLTQAQLDELRKVLGSLSTDSGGLALAQVGLGDDTGMFEHMSEAARDWASDHAAELVTQINDTTRSQVQQAIVDGYENNRSVAEIAGSIEDLGAFTEDRAALIASTEVRFANSYGALEGYKEAANNGVQLMKEWLAGPGACDDCQDNEDQGPIDLDDEFDSGDDAPPAHPNCRCAVSPVVFTAEEAEEE